jgi:hypothetical protein
VLGVNGIDQAAAARHGEAFYGTSQDAGARLKHEVRLRVAERRDAKREGPRPGKHLQPQPAALPAASGKRMVFD